MILWLLVKILFLRIHQCNMCGSLLCNMLLFELNSQFENQMWVFYQTLTQIIYIKEGKLNKYYTHESLSLHTA